MAQSLAAALRDVVAGADAIYALWTDRVRGLYVDPSITAVSENRIRRRQASSNLTARDRAADMRPQARAGLDRLAELIALALTFAAPEPISSTDLESRLSEFFSRAEDLVDHLADDTKHASRFREVRDRVELLALSLALSDDDGEDDDRGDNVQESGPPKPEPGIAMARDRRNIYQEGSVDDS